MRGLLCLAFVLLLILPGCASSGPSDGPIGQVTRQVTLTADPSTLHATDLGNVGSATFTYTYSGGDVASRDLSANYMRRDGGQASTPLSFFNAPATLHSGDRIVIQDARITSPLTIQKGSTVLARRGSSQPWVVASGVPLPFTGATGAVTWQMKADGTLQASLDGLNVHATSTEYTCTTMCRSTPYNTTTQVNGASLQANIQGNLDVTFDSASHRVSWSADGDLHAGSSANVDMVMDRDGVNAKHQSGALGYDVSFQAAGKGTVHLDLDGPTVQQVSGDGSINVDASGTQWDPDHPRAEAKPLNTHHPLYAASGSSSEAVPSGQSIPSDTATALRALWDMDLVAGDSFRFDVDSGQIGTERLQFSLFAVVSADNVQAAGDSRSALKVELRGQGTLSLEHQQPITFDAALMTLWLDAASYAPLKSDLSTQGSLAKSDVDNIIAALRQVAPNGSTITGPSDASASIAGGAHLSVTRLDGSPRFAPMAVLLGGPGAMLAGAAAFLGGVGSGLGHSY